ncbi:hypothetical protein N2152v2_001490 [Parachlorella kessleri]
MAAKIVELCREGLAAGDVERLLQQRSSPGISDLQQVFLPNMAYLRELLADALLGQDGAGVQLVLRAPIIATAPLLKDGRAVQQLVNLGLDTVGIRELVSVYPDLLMKDLEGPVQQQKLHLLRMASRLAFMRHLGLPDPGSLRHIGGAREPVFLAAVGKAAGREVSPAEFAEWVAAWLLTPEGQRWGFKPEKPKRARPPRG